MNKKVLLGLLLTALFALGVFAVLKFTLSGGKAYSWRVNGATIDDRYAIEGGSEGFEGDKACAFLRNRGRKLPVKVNKAQAGPSGAYRTESCDPGSDLSPGTGGRNGPPRLAQVAPCAEGVVLPPGGSCSLGLRLVAGGSPSGVLSLSTEVTCTTREIPPCGLLRADLRPTEDKPLVLGVDQKSEFPKTEEEFQITTRTALVTATETGPQKGGPATETVPVTETSTETETVTPAPDTEQVSPQPETSRPDTPAPGPGSGEPGPPGPEAPSS